MQGQVRSRRWTTSRGLKVRGVGAYGKVFTDLGATPVNMSVYEAYQGLETGLIDCTQTYPYLVKALKFDEVFDSYTELDWGQIGALGIMMNKDSFDALPPEDQTAIMTAGEGLADEFGRILTAANEEFGPDPERRGQGGRGDLGRRPPDADRGERDPISPNGSSARRRRRVWMVSALVDEYKALIVDYARQRDEKGYPWAPKG